MTTTRGMTRRMRKKLTTITAASSRTTGTITLRKVTTIAKTKTKEQQL